jgi:hypothetical protein
MAAWDLLLHHRQNVLPLFHRRNARPLLHHRQSSRQRQLGCTTPPPPEGIHWTRARTAARSWSPQLRGHAGGGRPADWAPRGPRTHHWRRARSTGPGADKMTGGTSPPIGGGAAPTARSRGSHGRRGPRIGSGPPGRGLIFT